MSSSDEGLNGNAELLPPKYKAIVVGAGLSGLSAAKYLQEAGVSFVVLEARDRIGGRIYTKKNPAPGVDYVDVGGAYIGPCQKYILRMARDLGVEKFAIDEPKGSTVYYDDASGRRRLFPADREPAIWNPIVLLDINNFFRTLDELSREIPMHAPWAAPRAKEWDQMTVKEFADKIIWTQTMRDMLHSFHTVRMASHPYEASLLWFLWHIREYGDIKRLLTTLGAEKWKFYGGAQKLCERIVEQLEPDAVQLKKPVVGVRQDDQDGVTVTTLDGSMYRADYVILATPPVIEQKIHFEPPMPAIRNQFPQHVLTGCVIKAVIFYEKPFWHDRGLSGAAVIDGGEYDDDFPINFTMDGTRPNGTFGALIGFIWTEKLHRLLVKTSKDDRMHLIARGLAKAFDDERFLKPILYEEQNWSAEQYSGGCYSMVLPPGTLTTYGSIMRKPIGRVFFGGTETAVHWIGHMDGAISSGERAAREVLHALGKISEDEIWVEEPVNKDDPPEVLMPFTPFERLLPSVGGLVTFLKGTAAVAVLALDILFALWWYRSPA